MRYLALATDYDGTIAHHGRVDEATFRALERLKESGRRLILVSGRELEDLQTVFDRFDLFDLAVLENGALLYRPGDRSEKLLGEPAPPEFVEMLRRKGVERVSVGRVIVATWEPHEVQVLEAIHELGQERQVIFNKGAVMVLPSGVNKAVGLEEALCELGLSKHNAVGVGDAENDHAFLSFCECSAAVANALPSIKDRADIVTRMDHGAGVVELIEGLLADDLAGVAPRLGRHAILLGRDDDDAEVRVEPYGLNVLVAGTSGSGKSTIVTGLLERLAEPRYQFVVIDPEGDYANLEHATTIGDPRRAPLAKEVLDLVEKDQKQDVVVNLLGIPLEHRPAAFDELLPRLLELRARTGRPHWIVVDETHHLIPREWNPSRVTLPRHLQGMLFITVHPESIAPDVLAQVGLVVAVGERPAETIGSFCEAVGEEAPEVDPAPLEAGSAIVWRRDARARPVRVRTEPPRTERVRHSRKYAEGDLGEDRSFRFRGPEGKLNLRAQNLVLFLQMADGVDDETWAYHLAQGDYSRWFREQIKDDDLAAAAEAVEAQAPTPAEGRAAIRAAVEERYTLPSGEPSGVNDGG
jgi:HAD superfamily hydrolase (TIGR01484 family)